MYSLSEVNVKLLNFEKKIFLLSHLNKCPEPYPYSNVPLRLFYLKFMFCLKLELCKLHKAACDPTKCDVVNDVKLFLSVLSWIY